MSTTSTAASIAATVKAILDGYDISRIGQQPTIRSVKNLTMELCNMASAVESDRTGGHFGHLYLILPKKEYRMASGVATATVDG
jgi:hypothetical protein